MSGSLTSRAIVAGIIWIAIALGAGGWLLMSVFHGAVVRQFDARLGAELDLLAAGIAASPADPSIRMTNPDFQRVYSGSYWQAFTPDGRSYRSRSLWDAELRVSAVGSAVSGRDATGPDGAPIRLLARSLMTIEGEHWTVAVARDRSMLQKEIALFQKTLWGAALALAAILLTAAFLLLRTALAPLNRLRAAVRDRHQQAGRIVGTYPVEVAPLVGDLNALLERNERLREKGRLQAANLAHALKTPAAILANELSKAQRGDPIDTHLSSQAIGNITAAADRHLGLVGAAPEDMAAPESTDVVPLARDVVRAIGRLFPDLSFELATPSHLPVSIGRTDLTEVLGNIVDNAAKWAERRVLLTLSACEQYAGIVVEDDGPGIPQALRSQVLHQGVRLDPSRHGSGLGLTIVADIVDRNHGSIVLKKAGLGGLCLTIRLPKG